MQPLPEHNEQHKHGTMPFPEDVQEKETTPPEKKQQSFFVEMIQFAILALVIVMPFRFFIAEPFIVSGASMSPTFETGQYLVTDRLTYRFSEPQRGDVVIFRFPNDPKKFFIKRVVGLPGEIIRIQNSTTSIVNPTTGESRVLEETYLPEGVATRSGTATVLLGSEEYFVMGDNRTASSDSREWGPVPKEDIIGRAYLRLLPPTQMAVLPGKHNILFLNDTITNN